ncbi:hypothetical protein CDAR_424031 [Caerostris darwini]|uniref:Uncharacterized protein n=1 Tax=Caerostris darwini TaxID=1538125 RepID=A0AAV4T472_9ARAC|nr:hypothetical protein CDAR_424031 [Caerostris darwini]
MKPAYQHLRDVIKDPCEWRRNRSGQLFRDPIIFALCLGVRLFDECKDGRQTICYKSSTATSTIIIPNNGGCPMKPAYQHLRDVIKDPCEWRRNRSGQLFRDPINSPSASEFQLFDEWGVQRSKKRNAIVGGRSLQ